MRHEPPTIQTPFAPPVRSLADLAGLLDLSVDELTRMVAAAPTLYTSFDQPKKSGGVRTIRPPRKALRAVQRRLYRTLQDRVRYPRWMMGGVPGRSIFTHARPHVGCAMVATLDVKSFFPSVTELHVRGVVEQFGIASDATDAVVRLTTLENQLPQGSPASCFLANMAFDGADRQIDALCRKHRLSYTRYVDDIAVSGDCDLRNFKGALFDAVVRAGFQVAPGKVLFMASDIPGFERQVVTNLVVNDKLRPTKAFIGDLEEAIWVCLEAGPEALALAEGLSVAAIKSRLTGRVSHLAQADPVRGKKLKGRLRGVEWQKRVTCEM